jgi:hypothetical protein
MVLDLKYYMHIADLPNIPNCIAAPLFYSFKKNCADLLTFSV